MAQKKINDTATQSKENEAETAEMPPKEWTIMIYMAGDNNLSEDMITSLKDLKVFAGNRYVNIVVLYDTNYPPKRPSVYDFTKRTTNGDLESFEVENGVYHVLGRPIPTRIQSDFFDSDIEFVPLKKFVPWVLKQAKFKANKYALILSGHSDGILGKTILRDDNPPNSLNLKKLGEVLEYCRRQLKISNPSKEKFDLIGFDSCLMAMLEPAYEIKDTAEVMVASEGNIPNAGWNYAAVFYELFQKRGKLNAKEFAESIVKSYACYNFDFIASGRAINISAFDLTKTEIFAKRLDLLAGILLRILNLSIRESDEKLSIMNGLFKQKFINYILQSHYYSQTFMHDQAADILDFEDALINNIFTDVLLFGLLFESASAKTSSKKKSFFMPGVIISSLKKYSELPKDHLDFVIKSCFVGADYQFSKGVSVFFPWSQMPLKMIFFEYNKLKFNKEHKKWKQFIRKYIMLTNRTPETKLLFDRANFENLFVNFQNNQIKAEDDKSISINILIMLLNILVSNEESGRQYINRQYINRGDAFYGYFQQLRNYSPFRLVGNPPKEVGLTNCCNKTGEDVKTN